jgi:hypothetical protein
MLTSNILETLHLTVRGRGVRPILALPAPRL